ncbi:hypothetical protein HK099_001356, partial [Clydaea vesicula]
AAELLLKAGAKQILVCTEKQPKTSLMSAAVNGHLELCKYLLDNGADLNAKTVHGYDACSMADIKLKPFFEDYKFNTSKLNSSANLNDD